MVTTDLELIDGARKAGQRKKPWRRQALDEAEQITCGVCEGDIGVATSAIVAVTLAPMRRPSGRVAGGRRILACAHCLARGKITELGKV